MISRWHVPLARADKNPPLVDRWNGKFPDTVFQRVGRWNECHRRRIAFPSRAPENVGGFGRGRDAAIRLGDDPQESPKLLGIAQLLRNLMESGLFQRDRDSSLRLFAFGQGVL